MTQVGAHWVRAALQVNPFGYQGQNAPSLAFDTEAEYNSDLLDECQRLGVELIAVTDHWCVDSAMGLLADADARGIVALPGFEANSSEGVHLLVVFEAGTSAALINSAIGICGGEPGCANGKTGASFKDILATMDEKGALVIPAHVNVANRGMLAAVCGEPLVKMVTDRNLHAIAVTPSQPAGTDQSSIIKGSRPYERKHPVAVIYADDVMHPNGLGAAGATSWFKVSTACLKSLKLAVRTPETRVSLSDPGSAPRSVLRQISWTGGFLDNVTLPISGDLTALIGGRGTGKSTAIESLRYALGIEPIGVEAQRDHKAIVSSVLRSGTLITVAVECSTPTPRRYTIERAVPNPPVVRDASGAITNQRPLDVLGAVEIFGQHELAELASDKTLVAKMVQRFAGTAEKPTAEHEEVLDQLRENREQLRRTEAAQVSLAEEIADIPRLQELVQRFRDTDVPNRLSDLQRIDQDEAVFGESVQRVQAVRNTLEEAIERRLDASLEADYEGIATSPREGLLRRAATATTALAVQLTTLTGQISIAIEAAEAEIASAKSDWDAAVELKRESHAQVLRQLHDEGRDPDTYLATTRALDALKAKEPRGESLAGALTKLADERTKLLAKLADFEKARLETLHVAVRKANAATGGVVVVKPVAAPDRSHIMGVISGYVSGARTQISAAVEADDFAPAAFVATVRAGVSELEKIGVRGAQARNLVDAGEEMLRHIEELSVGHAVDIQLDIGAGTATREYKPIGLLSKGQRATALLLLLLGASNAPLVIDQPEDDLDNRFVYDGVVARLRELKGSRQIIASTHNANIPVLGDAELIVAFEGDGLHGWPTPNGVGSLDDASIRGLVESILEGGPAAFNARQHLYGF